MIFSAPSQIALRQIEYFADKHVLVAGELKDDFPSELVNHCASVSVFTTNYGYFNSQKDSKHIRTYFGAELTQASDANLILLYWPKAKAEADFLLTMLLAKLGKGTEICVVGENRSGVKSIEKMFAPFGPITKYDSARHCSFYWGQCTQEAPSFELDSYFKSYVVTVADQEIQVRSLPGVFSHGEFDKGSQLLVDTLPTLKGKVLDFGCGAGVLGSVMKILNPNIEINMCDISALAIASSEATLKANNLQGHVFVTDVYSNTDNNYHFIIELTDPATLSPMTKQLVFNSDDLKGLPSKTEGIAMLNDKTLLLVNDNDFGIDGKAVSMVKLSFPTKVIDYRTN
ncbi:MAG: methyltransferase [Aliivibrio sp.]|nr:methyltransferase [Aliivibrio sp.]